MSVLYSHFIGIDIGKFEFVVNVHESKKTNKFSNDLEGLGKFCEEFADILDKSLVVLEVTGGYERLAINYLQRHNIAVHRANGRQVKSFIRSYGIIGKTDSIDATALALYGSERQASLKPFEPNKYDELRELGTRRADLVKMRTQEKNRVQAPSSQVTRKTFDAMIKVLNEQIATLDEQMNDLIESSAELKLKKDTLKSIPGVGDISACAILTHMPEIGTMNQKQVASLAGVAPHPNQSGTKNGYYRTRGGRRQMRPILFIAALSASKSKTIFGDFYRKLTQNGKPKMCAMVALMRKIMLIGNARIKSALASA